MALQRPPEQNWPEPQLPRFSTFALSSDGVRRARAAISWENSASERGAAAAMVAKKAVARMEMTFILEMGLEFLID